MLSLRLSCSLRLEFEAPSPPNPVCGREGLEVADIVLKDYRAVGMLIGGVAKELWRGKTSDNILMSHKDVDVLILSQFCDHHPEQYEGGIDWWICHFDYERPSNGNDVGLTWLTKLSESGLGLRPGLYLCPFEALRTSVQMERKFFESEYSLPRRSIHANSIGYPVLRASDLLLEWGQPDHDQADHCKSCY